MPTDSDIDRSYQQLRRAGELVLERWEQFERDYTEEQGVSPLVDFAGVASAVAALGAELAQHPGSRGS